MKWFYNILLITLLAPLLWGCEGDDDTLAVTPMPVIEGWINSGFGPDIVLTQTITPAKETSLAEVMVTWAKVTVSDGDEEVVLTCGYNQAYSPPYHYYSHAMIGEPGKTYTVRAETSTFTATAVSTMPYPTPIDSITTAPVADSEDYTANLWFTSPRDVPAYYYLTMRKPEGKKRRPLPTMLGAISVTRPGAPVTIPVFNPRNRLDSADYSPNFKPGELIEVSLNRVDRVTFDFWQAYNNVICFGGNLFISADSEIPTNISGGFGIWSAQGTSTTRYRFPSR